jgi:hypothetical protein
MQTDAPTDEMIAQFLTYCFDRYGNPYCPFHIFEKTVYLRIEDKQDDSQSVTKSTDATYSCHIFGGSLIQNLPFYLVLTTEANYYKESNINYLQIVNGQNYFDEPQAKILAYVRQD